MEVINVEWLDFAEQANRTAGSVLVSTSGQMVIEIRRTSVRRVGFDTWDLRGKKERYLGTFIELLRAKDIAEKWLTMIESAQEHARMHGGVQSTTHSTH